MDKKFIINLLFLIGINLVVKPFYVFGIDIKVQNEVNNYGLYFALMSFSYIFQILTDLGLYQYNNRKIARYGFLFEKYFKHIVLLKGLLSILFFTVAFSFALILEYNAQALHLLFFLLFNQVLITYIFYFRSNISGLQYYKTDSFISIMDKLCMILVCSLCFLLLGDKPFMIEWFVYFQTLSFLITFLFALVVNLRLQKKPQKIKPRLAVWIVLLKKSAPFSLVVILMTLYTRIDVVMIERMLFNDTTHPELIASNIYAAAYRLLEVLNMLGLLFAGLLLPMFSKMIKEKSNFLSLYKLSSSLIFMVSLPVSISFWICSEEIMRFLYVDFQASMPLVATILIFGFNSIAIIHISGTLLTANGSLKQLNLVFLIAIVLNALLNYFWIPRYGAIGAAYATLCTQTMVAFFEVVLVFKYFKPGINIIYILQIILFVCLCFGAGSLFQQYELLWVWKFLLICATAGLGGLVIGLINIKQIFSSFKYN